MPKISTNLQCVILAGGLGTRMRKILQDKPKSLLSVGGHPFLELQLKWLKRLGMEDIILLLANGAQEIKEYLNRQKILPVTVFTDGEQPLGTGGAIRNVCEHLNENFLVTYGDSFLFLDPKRLFETHLKGKVAATLSVYKNNDEGDKSNVQILENGKIRYQKRNPSRNMDAIDYGMMALNRSALLEWDRGSFDLADYLEWRSERDQLLGFSVLKSFYEVGSPEGYEKFSKFMLSYDYDVSQISL